MTANLIAGGNRRTSTKSDKCIPTPAHCVAKLLTFRFTHINCSIIE